MIPSILCFKRNKQIELNTKECESKPQSVLSHNEQEPRWTKKHDKTYFGYKDHVPVDQESNMIRDYHFTPAISHDSQPTTYLIAADETYEFWGDPPYPTPEIKKLTKNKALQITSQKKCIANDH